jgi:hypothetical protein
MWFLLRKIIPSYRRRGDHIYKQIIDLGTKIDYVMGSEGARKQERFCWGRPATIYWTVT